MTFKRIAVTGASVAAIAAFLAWAFAPAPEHVETARVARGTYVRTVDEDGKTRVRHRFVVSSPLAGTLQRIALKEGDRVAAGDVLARILPAKPTLLDARTERELTARLEGAEAQVLNATANIGRAEAAADLARAEATRVDDLAGKGFVSPAARDAARLTLEARVKELEAAREERHVASHALDAARATLSEAMSGSGAGRAKPWPVKAPAGGVVLRVLQESERDVLTGTPLLEIGDPTELEVAVDVLSSDAVSIRAGDRVMFEHWGADRPAEGRVRRVEPSAFTKVSALGVEEQRVNVIIDPTSTDERWQSVGDGYRVDVRIVVDEREDVLMLPTSALFREGEQWMLFVVIDGRARKRPVAIAARAAQAAVVGSGVDEDAQVVVYPGSALDDGSRVVAVSAGR